MVVALGVDGQDDALAAETLGRFADQFGTADSGRVDRYLVSTGPQDLVEVVDAADAAANGKGNGNGFGYGADDVDEDMAFFMGRRNIVEDEFVGELVGIEFPQFDRVVDVLMCLNCLPLTTRPSRTSRHGTIRFANILHSP